MNTPRRHIGALLAIVVVAGATGCANSGPKPDPLQEALAESREVVADGVEDGFEESETVDEYVVRARQNPCPCEAPPYEVYVHGRWTRVFLEGAEAVVAEVDGHFEEANEVGELAVVSVRGEMSGDRTSEEGLEFPVFEVAGLGHATEEETGE